MLTGYKTVIVAVLVAIIGALQGLDWVNLMPAGSQAVGWVTTALGVIMFVLRAVTTTPLGSDKP